MTMMRVGIGAWHLILLAVNHYVIFYWVNEKSVDGSNGWPIKNDGLSISSIFIAQTSTFFKDAPFNSLRICMKRNSSDEKLGNHIWSTLLCFKEVHFQTIVFRFL